jgi:hypothetical protein
MPDINRADKLTNEVSDTIDDMFEYHAWNEDQQQRGKIIREVLAGAVKEIVRLVPPSPDRTVAIRKIREARMDVNSAITHGGKY